MIDRREWAMSGQPSTMSPRRDQVVSMLQNESKSMNFYLPQLPRTIIREMVYKRTKPRARPAVRAVPEREIIVERKKQKRIFTEGISEDSRLNRADFCLGEQITFNATNLPEQTIFYRSRKGNSIHLNAWHHRYLRHRSRSPPNERGPRSPTYTVYKQGLPGERTLCLPKLSMPHDYRRQVSVVKTAPEPLPKKVETPRVEQRAQSNYSRIPPNTPAAPIPPTSHLQRLSLGLGSQTTIPSETVDSEDNDITAPPPSDGTVEELKATKSPRVAMKQIMVGDNVPSVINVELKQKQQLREMYPMFDHMERRKEKPKIPIKRRPLPKPDVPKSKKENQFDFEKLLGPIKTSPHQCKVMVVNKDYQDADQLNRTQTKSVEIPKEPLLTEHLNAVKIIAKNNSKHPGPLVKEDTFNLPHAPPPSAQMMHNDEPLTDSMYKVAVESGEIRELEVPGEETGENAVDNNEVEETGDLSTKGDKVSTHSGRLVTSRRTSSMLEVPVAIENDMERPPSSLGSVDETAINETLEDGMVTVEISVENET